MISTAFLCALVPHPRRKETLSGDLLKKFAAKYPPTLHWKDRRSIAALHLSTSEADHHSVTNHAAGF